MIDIVSNVEGLDVGVFDTQTARAANILSVQLGALEYAPLLGIDLKYFLSEDFEFQTASFKAYLIDRLAASGINVSAVSTQIENLFESYGFVVENTQQSGGLIAR